MNFFCRDAGHHGAAEARGRRQAAEGRQGGGLHAHQRADGGADRDAGRAGRAGALGGVQHLLNAKRGGRRACRGRLCHFCVARRVRGGLLVVHRQVRQRRELAAQYDPRRRRRRHPPHAQEVPGYV